MFLLRTNFNLNLFILVSMTVGLHTWHPADCGADDAVDFDRQVQPLFVAHCLDCHNAADHKGELDLSNAKHALRQIKRVIVAGDAEESVLWKLVNEGAMPPEQPLTEQEKLILKLWIDQGAQWGSTNPIDRFAYTTAKRAGADWWSLRPVERPELPTVENAAWIRNPLDAFVLAKLESRNIKPAGAADRLTLIRRVTFDLIGLPPTLDEIDQFVNDTRPDAYARLVDRLLDSQHYGERWARHWLDIARFTESQGFEYDRFRPNAWHYRDYVINALNADKPYNIFLQEQIAGDVTNFAEPGHEVTSDGMVATSLLVCGPWDQAGNAQANVTQKRITREEELEDLVSVIGQSLLGMTINCARCHSHKFDPIPQEDYYRFKAVFEGIKHGERSIETAAEATAQSQHAATLHSEAKAVERKVAELQRVARAQVVAKLNAAGSRNPTLSAAPAAYAHWSFAKDGKDDIGSMHGELVGGATLRDGRLVLNGQNQFMRTSNTEQDISEKTLEAWVLLPTLNQGGGGVITLQTVTGAEFDSIVFAERQPGKWIAGSNGFVRTRDLEADRESSERELIHVAIVYRADKSIAMYRNGVPYGESYLATSLVTYKSGKSQVLLGLRHTGGGNGSLIGEIESASLYNAALNEQDIAASYASGPNGGAVITTEQILATMTAAQRDEYESAVVRAKQLREEVERFPKPRVSYVGLRQQPEPTALLVRGDVTKPGEVVSPGAISAIKLQESEFQLAADAPEADRRVQLARWLVNPKHPLTPRVMVNRLWHYHFGRGIVETPNDFGFNGARPTHPELLDWLASEFVDGSQPWSIKHMHRLILNSATYQQASTFNASAMDVDADNTLLWRFTPHRLEGEIIRDAMLAVSGELNRTVGGPSFMPFIVTKFNSDFYQPIDPLGPEFNRRTIYRANINSGKSAMMDALDCPDPSIKTPARRVTTTPLAALALMNNSFVLRQANKLAGRLTTSGGGETTNSIQKAYLMCFARPATDSELRRAVQFVNDQGLETFCWVLLNATEFLYVN